MDLVFERLDIFPLRRSHYVDAPNFPSGLLGVFRPPLFIEIVTQVPNDEPGIRGDQVQGEQGRGQQA